MSAYGRVLLRSGFGVTAVVGTFQEAGRKPGVEKSFFVVNLHDSSKFSAAIAKLGEANSQDSVFIIPKGGFIEPRLCYLLGTNDNPFCPLGEKRPAKAIKFGKADSRMLTNVGGRPFYFTFTDLVREDFLRVPLRCPLQAMRLVDEAVDEMLLGLGS